LVHVYTKNKYLLRQARDTQRKSSKVYTRFLADCRPGFRHLNRQSACWLN
jgi:hypothetical protein